MQTNYTEASYKNSIIELFQNMGYTHIYGSDIENRDFYSPLYDEVLAASIRRLNKNVPEQAIYLARYGNAAWNKKYAAYVSKDYSDI